MSVVGVMMAATTKAQKDGVLGISAAGNRPVTRPIRGENKDDGGNFKDDAKTELDHDEQIEVLRGADDRVQAHVLPHLNEELNGERKRDEVAEQAAQSKKQR